MLSFFCEKNYRPQNSKVLNFQITFTKSIQKYSPFVRSFALLNYLIAVLITIRREESPGSKEQYAS